MFVCKAIPRTRPIAAHTHTQTYTYTYIHTLACCQTLANMSKHLPHRVSERLDVTEPARGSGMGSGKGQGARQ